MHDKVSSRLRDFPDPALIAPGPSVAHRPLVAIHLARLDVQLPSELDESWLLDPYRSLHNVRRAWRQGPSVLERAHMSGDRGATLVRLRRREDRRQAENESGC